ncbi:unnamed protein product [Calicophoron daubneyi]|uniref:SWIM-type domain-containing protein n=1 Tax=Calicophoron daubneyi TaxID=300641 RepID=A0AAV2TN14_CALDB
MMAGVRASKSEDVTNYFTKIVGFKDFYSFEELQNRLRLFQLESGTSYHVEGSLTVKGYEKKTGRILPERLKYQHVRYECVHSGNRPTFKGNSRYGNFGCRSVIVYTHRDGWLHLTSYYLVHSHTVDVKKTFVYPRNRRLDRDQQREVRALIHSVASNRELVQYVERNFGIRLYTKDICNLRQKVFKEDHVDGEFTEIYKLLRGCGGWSAVADGKRRTRVLAFTSNALKELFSKYGEVLLADATHQIERGGYILWHTMVVDVTGISRSVFYCLLPSEVKNSYSIALCKFKEIMPNTERVQTVVLDGSTAQLAAFREHFPSARLLFCRRHVIDDFQTYTRSLKGLSGAKRGLLFSWMRSLCYARTERQFQEFLYYIKSRSNVATKYLENNWLKVSSNWAGYYTKEVLNFGNYTTNCVKNENRWIRRGLKESSRMIQFVEKVISRNVSLDLGREKSLDLHGMKNQVKDELFPGSEVVLGCLSSYAAELVRENFIARDRSSICQIGDRVVVACARETHMVLLSKQVSCSCTFYHNWHLPCRHAIHATLYAGKPISILVSSNRWIQPVKMPRSLTEISENNTSIGVAEHLCKEPLRTRVEKLRLSKGALEDLQGLIIRLEPEKFDEYYRRVLDITEEIRGIVSPLNNGQDLSLDGPNNEGRLQVLSMGTVEQHPCTSSTAFPTRSTESVNHPEPKRRRKSPLKLTRNGLS